MSHPKGCSMVPNHLGTCRAEACNYPFCEASETFSAAKEPEPVYVVPRFDFEDLYGQKCSAQDSSLAGTTAMWLGVDVKHDGTEIRGRMHLDQKLAETLIPLLQRFVDTGSVR